MPSPFASLTVSEPIPLPFEGQWIRVRKLTGKQYEQAQAAHRDGFAAGATKAWALTFRRALEKGASDPDVLKALSDPLTGFDRYTLARCGLAAWSFDREIGAEAIDDLDDETVDFIAREVLKATKPGLFAASAEDAEDAQVKG